MQRRNWRKTRLYAECLYPPSDPVELAPPPTTAPSGASIHPSTIYKRPSDTSDLRESLTHHETRRNGGDIAEHQETRAPCVRRALDSAAAKARATLRDGNGMPFHHTRHRAYVPGPGNAGSPCIRARRAIASTAAVHQSGLDPRVLRGRDCECCAGRMRMLGCCADVLWVAGYKGGSRTAGFSILFRLSLLTCPLLRPPPLRSAVDDGALASCQLPSCGCSLVPLDSRTRRAVEHILFDA